MLPLLLATVLACSGFENLTTETTIRGTITDQDNVPLSGTAKICYSHHFLIQNSKSLKITPKESDLFCETVVVDNDGHFLIESAIRDTDLNLWAHDGVPNEVIKVVKTEVRIGVWDEFVQDSYTDIVVAEPVEGVDSFLYIEADTLIKIDNNVVDTLQ